MYRRIYGFSLVLFLILLGSAFLRPSLVEGKIQSVISRFMIVEKGSLAFGAGTVDEESVLKSGLLDPCPDGRIHLDWPVSRGVAAQVLWRILQKQPGFIPAAGYFLDIGPESPLAEALAKVGGAFVPIDRNRFKPDRLIREQELEEIIEALKKRLPDGIASITPPPASIVEPLPPLEKHYDAGFTFPAPQPSLGELLLTSDETASGSASTTVEADIARLERLNRIVPPDQLSTSDGFDLRECEDGMAEIEKSLDSLEITILDLSGMPDLDAKEDKQVREALTQLETVLAGVGHKLRLSERTLAVALLVDSDSIRRAAVLKQRIRHELERVVRLADRLHERLQRPPEEKTE